MSSSDSSPNPVKSTTRVFIGGGMSRESMVTVEDLQGRSSLDRWSKEVEREVMQRVQARAAEKAKEVLAKAQEEARQIRDEAHVQGFNQGIAEAQQQLQQAHQEMAESLAQSLASVQAGRDAIWQTHRQDLTQLVLLTVERICGLELTQQRKEVLAGFLEEALEALDNHSGLNLTVHPEDEPVLQELLQSAGQRHPRLSAWRVRTDPKMQAGGLLVESDHGMVDSTIEGRRAIIEPILQQLTLPLPETDDGGGK